MNYEELINLAKSNEKNKKPKSSLYYPAKLGPPKKETWKSQMKSLPCNVVKKYLSNEETKEQVNVLKREDYKKVCIHFFFSKIFTSFVKFACLYVEIFEVAEN